MRLQADASLAPRTSPRLLAGTLLVLGAVLAASSLAGRAHGQEVSVDPRAVLEGAMPVAGEVDPASLRNLEEMLDISVFNAVDEEIGEIEGYIVSGDRLAYARIALGGFIGLGGSEIMVPFASLSFRTARGGRDEDGLEAVLSTVRTQDQLEGLDQPAEARPQVGTGGDTR